MMHYVRLMGPIWYAKICQQPTYLPRSRDVKGRKWSIPPCVSASFRWPAWRTCTVALFCSSGHEITSNSVTVHSEFSTKDMWKLEKAPPLQFSYVLHSLYTITPIHIDTFRIFQARILLVLPVPYNVDPDCPTTQKLSNVCAFASGPFMNNMTGEKFTSAFSPWSKQHHETSVHSSRNKLELLSSCSI